MQYPNGRYFNASPGRFFGGTTEGFLPYNCMRGDRLNRFVNEQWSKVVGGLPTGYGVRGSILPQIAGGLSYYDATALIVSATATARDGRPMSGTVTAGGTLIGALASLLSGAITAGGTLTGAIGGRASPTATAAGTGTASATIGGRGSMAGTATGTATLTASIAATGYMAGDITSYIELSPQNLAKAAYDLMHPDLVVINNGVKNTSIFIPHFQDL